MTAKRAPEALQGLEWVVICCSAPVQHQDHPCGARSVPAGPPCPGASLPENARLLANKARFHHILLKVSQNDEVSTKYVEKASHSPYLQKRSQKSPLEFLRFPLSAAFSPKELMGLFWLTSKFSVKMTKCRQCAHTNVTRKGRQIPPQVDPASWFCRPAPHLAQRGILIATRYY